MKKPNLQFDRTTTLVCFGIVCLSAAVLATCYSGLLNKRVSKIEEHGAAKLDITKLEFDMLEVGEVSTADFIEADDTSDSNIQLVQWQGQPPTRILNGVDQHAPHRGEPTWRDSKPIPWEAFAYGEYIGPARTPAGRRLQDSHWRYD